MKLRKQALPSVWEPPVLLILTGLGWKRGTTVSGGGDTDAFARHVAMLRSGKAQEKAAAAYWLGQQKSASAGRLIHSWSFWVTLLRLMLKNIANIRWRK